MFPHDEFIDDEPVETYDDDADENEYEEEEPYAAVDDAEAPFIMDADFMPEEVCVCELQADA